jgi:hypothetical protein
VKKTRRIRHRNAGAHDADGPVGDADPPEYPGPPVISAHAFNVERIKSLVVRSVALSIPHTEDHRKLGAEQLELGRCRRSMSHRTLEFA